MVSLLFSCPSDRLASFDCVNEYMFCTSAAKESLGPYAWQEHTKKDMDVTSDMDSCQRADNTAGMDLSPASLPRAATVLGATELHQKLHLRLPKKVGTPGHVLRHAIEVFEDLHSRRKPMSFKFGFTHDPVFRWSNPIYGYAHCVQKYERMDILYASNNATGPGFLEAALVNLYKGAWETTYCYTHAWHATQS